jgi:hypothetical protein
MRFPKPVEIPTDISIGGSIRASFKNDLSPLSKTILENKEDDYDER